MPRDFLVIISLAVTHFQESEGFVLVLFIFVCRVSIGFLDERLGLVAFIVVHADVIHISEQRYFMEVKDTTYKQLGDANPSCCERSEVSVSE